MRPSLRMCRPTVTHTLHSCAEDTFVREWALWAIRNMCEISADAQKIIRCAHCRLLVAHVLTNFRRELEAKTTPTLS